MELLNLGYNSLKSIRTSNLSECIHNIDDLRLNKCDITEDGVKALAEKIKKRNMPVCYLQLFI